MSTRAIDLQAALGTWPAELLDEDEATHLGRATKGFRGVAGALAAYRETAAALSANLDYSAQGKLKKRHEAAREALDEVASARRAVTDLRNRAGQLRAKVREVAGGELSTADALQQLLISQALTSMSEIEVRTAVHRAAADGDVATLRAVAHMPVVLRGQAVPDNLVELATEKLYDVALSESTRPAVEGARTLDAAADRLEQAMAAARTTIYRESGLEPPIEGLEVPHVETDDDGEGEPA